MYTVNIHGYYMLLSLRLAKIIATAAQKHVFSGYEYTKYATNNATITSRRPSRRNLLYSTFQTCFSVEIVTINPACNNCIIYTIQTATEQGQKQTKLPMATSNKSVTLTFFTSRVKFVYKECTLRSRPVTKIERCNKYIISVSPIQNDRNKFKSMS